MGARLSVDTNALAAAAGMGESTEHVRGEAHRVVIKATAALQRAVVRNASGRPGPNAITGDYRRRINRRVMRWGATSSGLVGTDAPQGRRLELGFVGTDSLGRVYDQAPFPHFGPALDEAAPALQAALAEVIADPGGPE